MSVCLSEQLRYFSTRKWTLLYQDNGIIGHFRGKTDSVTRNNEKRSRYDNSGDRDNKIISPSKVSNYTIIFLYSAANKGCDYNF